MVGESGQFSVHDLEQAEKRARLEAQQESFIRNVQEIKENQNLVGSKVAELMGRVNEAIPALQRDVSKTFEMIEEREETDRIYHEQARQSAKDISGLVEVLEKKASKESVDSCYTWIRGGFVATAISLLALIIHVILKGLGVL